LMIRFSLPDGPGVSVSFLRSLYVSIITHFALIQATALA
jgi:hypothetical protein